MLIFNYDDLRDSKIDNILDLISKDEGDQCDECILDLESFCRFGVIRIISENKL